MPIRIRQNDAIPTGSERIHNTVGYRTFRKVLNTSIEQKSVEY
jgi:hypothetical protein